MTKNDSVTYQVRKQTVRARVDRVHRDGTATITALFFVDDSGNDVPGFLGYKHRVGQDALSAQGGAA